MDWITTERDGREYVELRGDVDLYSASQFAEEMTTRMARGNVHFVFDFHLVEYLDSSGVGAIIKLLQRSRLNKCTLSFSGIHGSPRRVLEMSNILPLLKEEV